MLNEGVQNKEKTRHIGDLYAHVDDMWQYLPKPNITKSKVSKLGRRLEGKISVDRAGDPDIIEAFAAFNDWRASHSYVLKRAEMELSRVIKSLGYDFDTPNRLKRIETVRRKLSPTDYRKHSIPLGSIYDLGGLRVVCNNIIQVKQICSYYHTGSKAFEVDNGGAGKDYISNPQASGYRSHHFVLKFDGSGKDRTAHKGQRVELQVRTIRQHIWATASEGIGLLLGCSFKHGEGDPRWHDLFKAMSDILAIGDGLPISNKDRLIRRVIALESELSALSKLRRARECAIREECFYAHGWVILDYAAGMPFKERVRFFYNYFEAREVFEDLERKNPDTNATFLAVHDDFELAEAYPNYFMDMTAFAKYLEMALGGEIHQGEITGFINQSQRRSVADSLPRFF